MPRHIRRAGSHCAERGSALMAGKYGVDKRGTVSITSSRSMSMRSITSLAVNTNADAKMLYRRRQNGGLDIAMSHDLSSDHFHRKYGPDFIPVVAISNDIITPLK